MSTPIFYLAHCLNAPTPDGIAANISDTKLWLKFLVETVPEVGFCASWLPYVEMLDETKHRARGMRDNFAMIDRCDGFVMTGPTFSSGIKGEIERFHSRSAPTIRIVNLIGIPLIDSDGLVAHVCAEFARVL